MSDATSSPLRLVGDSVLGAVRLDGGAPHVIAAPIIGVQCHYCSKFCRPGEYLRIGQSVVMCWKCEENHRPKIHGFAPPKECQGCHTETAVLADRTPGGQYSMFVHWKDGEYQMLCQACSDAYIGKRKDLYGRTKFGWDIKLW